MKISDNIEISSIFMQPIPETSIFCAEKDLHGYGGKCTINCTCKKCKKQHCSKNPSKRRQACVMYEHVNNYFMDQSHFNKVSGRSVPDEMFLYENEKQIRNTIKKMKEIGSYYRVPNERAAKAEATNELLMELREEDIERYEERYDKQQEQYEERYDKQQERYDKQQQQERERYDKQQQQERERYDKQQERYQREERERYDKQQQRYDQLNEKLLLLTLEQRKELEEKYRMLKKLQNP